MNEANKTRVRIAQVDWVAPVHNSLDPPPTASKSSVDAPMSDELRNSKELSLSTELSPGFNAGATQEPLLYSPSVDSRPEDALLAPDASTPRSTLFDDIYFSGDGLAETRHVFLDGNNLENRFRTASHFTIAETGFGTGLNFLATWELWRRIPKSPSARLHFFSTELYPLSVDDLTRAHEVWPSLAVRAARLREALGTMTEGFQQFVLDDDVALTLGIQDAGDALSKISKLSGETPKPVVDAWFFDGFSPAKNPDLWRPELFLAAARLSKPGATFSTFTVAGAVRRAAADAGFTVEKRPGFGRKREMLGGVLDAAPVASHSPPDTDHRTIGTPAQEKPWASTANISTLKNDAVIAIVGGGIAGASVAAALRQQGFSPTILAPKGLSDGASGNQGGLIMPRLDLDHSPAAQFFRAAYLFALRTIDQYSVDENDDFFTRCGVIARPLDDDDARKQQRVLDETLLPPGMVEPHDDGLFFPDSGVIAPKEYVDRLVGRTPVINARLKSLTRDGEVYNLTLEGDNASAAHRSLQANAVVFANGRDALRFLPCRTLPLQSIAGQLDWFPSASALQMAVTAGPYIAPAPGGGLLAGATYTPIGPDEDPHPTQSDTHENWIAAQSLSGAPPGAPLPSSPAANVPRAAIRCQTPDHLPVVGALPDWAWFGAHYDDLRHGRPHNYPLAVRQPGLFILSGLGSRGLVTAPLCGAIIAALMVGAPPPVDPDVLQELDPGRFFIRSLKRARHHQEPKNQTKKH